MSNDSPRAKARQLIHDVYVRYGHPVQSVVVDEAREQASSTERSAAEQVGWERLFGDVERTRSKTDRLRRGERTVSHVGEQISIPLLNMTVPQARATNATKQAHAAGVAENAEFERQIIDIAEERMRERGVDPLLTEMVIGDFIDSGEVAALRLRDAA